MMDRSSSSNQPISHSDLDTLLWFVLWLIGTASFATLFSSGAMALLGLMYIGKPEGLPVPQPWFSGSMISLAAVCLLICYVVSNIMERRWPQN